MAKAMIIKNDLFIKIDFVVLLLFY